MFSGASSIPAQPLAVLAAGDRVVVAVDDQESNSRNPIKIPKGTKGIVDRIDDRGYVIIDFDCIDGRGEYISKQNIGILSKRETMSMPPLDPVQSFKSVSTSPSRPAPPPKDFCKPSTRSAQPAKGILKRRTTKKSLTTFQKFINRVRDPCTRFAEAWLTSCGRRNGSQVKFKSTVKCIEFSPRLDNETVPGDNTIVCLGLGKVVAKREIPYAQQPRKRPRVEERAYIPERDRIKLLRNSMGDKCFFVHWQQHRRATRKVITERKDTNNSLVDRAYMPESLREAQDRAARNAKECKFMKMEKRLDMCPEKLLWKIDGGVKIVRHTPLKRHRKKVKSVLSNRQESEDKENKRIISSNVLTQCHVCSRPISSLLKESCQCLSTDNCMA
jgi:hypothetical protein|mmetsp:Transcript_25443/g.40217  ORF Transcript_25443/g.40217 Transcript_25443/m.40217 type:complete len:386 (+) Transcript_25443:53-1210(+)